MKLHQESKWKRNETLLALGMESMGELQELKESVRLNKIACLRGGNG